MTEKKTTEKQTGKTDSDSSHAPVKKTEATPPTLGGENQLPYQKNNDPMYKVKKKSEGVVRNVRKLFNMPIGTNPYEFKKVQDTIGKVYSQPYQENSIQKKIKENLGN